MGRGQRARGVSPTSLLSVHDPDVNALSFMDVRFAELIHDGDHLTAEDWGDGFRTQTGQNINVAANGIAKLLHMMIEDDD